ncbi:rod-binding protein [Rhizorhabdus argentea]|uniref:rod-binding protein n=1 Tax=Rhizorhabdus argentea TaxID=1387174 RepID=UPI0030ECA621
MIGSVSIKTGALADPKASELEQLKAAAKQFEAVFTRQMLKSMRDAKLSDDDLFGSDATDQFREMQDSNFADQMAGKGAIGIADLLVKQFQARVSKTPAAGTAAGAPGAAGAVDVAPKPDGTSK